MRAYQKTRRAGATAVESAVVLLVLFLLVIGLIIGGVGVFRYQQVACIANEAARWTSVRGSDYQTDTNQASPTKQQILQQAVLPYAVGMDPTALSVGVQWIDQSTGNPTDWDASTKHVRSITTSGQYISNSVQITITYQWAPGFLWNSISFQNVCEIAITY